MAASELTLEQIYQFLKEKGGKVKNRDAVRYFKGYLTDPQTKEENRVRFKTYINTLSHTKTEGDEKVLILKTKYLNSLDPPPSPKHPSLIPSPQNDPRNSIGIPLSPSLPDFSPRQPPPYRPPPPVSSPSASLDNISFGSLTSLNETPQAPPRRRDIERTKSVAEETTPKKGSCDADANNEDKQTVSVKERTQKFNRLASVEDELSPRQPKSPEKSKSSWGADEDDGASVIPLEPKKCMEWYVTASKGDFQELLKLANAEPRLVNKKN
ncbi:ankyrin repeat domain-containing protein SOWAHC [Anoplophora glabripennis]|uniref:ankyrin repeat domain-containing protein SOWAHC n=1 Tax=Anoplophora glabripennis TaxID=217634 RepID=UPI000C78F46C|nr:ankyrin repeat domain-containing protein SOWAHC [Anoplophora glabripennis]